MGSKNENEITRKSFENNLERLDGVKHMCGIFHDIKIFGNDSYPLAHT